MPIKNEEGTSQADVPTIAKDENGEDYSMDDIVIKVEDVASIMTVTKKEEGTDTGEDVLAAIQEEDAAAQAPGGPPPGYMRLQDFVVLRRCWLDTITDVTPPYPPGLDHAGMIDWEYYHHLTTILNHLLFVYKDDENPRESVWNFYEVWLVANPITHEDSPFRSFFTADALFLHESDGKKWCEDMAAGRPYR